MCFRTTPQPVAHLHATDSFSRWHIVRVLEISKLHLPNFEPLLVFARLDQYVVWLDIYFLLATNMCNKYVRILLPVIQAYRCARYLSREAC